MNKEAFHQFLYKGEQLYSNTNTHQVNAKPDLDGLVVLVDEPEQLNPAAKDLLGKILGSIGREISSSRLMSVSQLGEYNMGDAVILAFLKDSNARNLGISEHFTIKSFRGAQLILSPSLAELHENKDMKISLWTELKKLRN